MVAGRWAMTIVVRPRITSASALADLVLLGGVDRRRGVVEDQHAGVGEDGAGQGDALALPARQREAPLAEQRCRSPRAGAAMNSWAPASRAARSTRACGRVGVGEGDVGPHRVAEEERVLEHDADGVAQLAGA